MFKLPQQYKLLCWEKLHGLTLPLGTSQATAIVREASWNMEEGPD